MPISDIFRSKHYLFFMYCGGPIMAFVGYYGSIMYHHDTAVKNGYYDHMAELRANFRLENIQKDIASGKSVDFREILRTDNIDEDEDTEM